MVQLSKIAYVIRQRFWFVFVLILVSCGQQEESFLISVQTPIPVRPTGSSTASTPTLSNPFSTLMNVTPGVNCYQNNLFLSIEDSNTQQIMANKPVKLRTNLSTYGVGTYSSASSGVSTVINHLLNQSFLEEPLEILIPRDRPVRVMLSGQLMNPVDVNLDGFCDDLDLTPSLVKIETSQETALSTSRFAHTSTLLPNGKILVIGGETSGAIKLSSAALFDPITKTWTTAANLTDARALHTATLLPNGKVLVLGGFGSSGNPIATAELYDPSSNTWTSAGSMSSARSGHTATLIGNKVMVIGGISTSTGNPVQASQSYLINSNTWETANILTFSVWHHTATLLPNGILVVIGGYTANSLTSASNAVYYYNPNTTNWNSGTSGSYSRGFHTANVIPNYNSILVVGGRNASENSIDNVDVYSWDAGGGSWTAQTNLSNSRYKHTTNITRYGTIVVAGGEAKYSSSVVLLNAFALARWTGTSLVWITSGIPTLASAKKKQTSTLLPDGQIVFIGGDKNTTTTLATDETEMAAITFPASFKTSVMGRSFVDQEALQQKKINLSIQLLHANPTGNYTPLMTTTPSKYSNWIELTYPNFQTATNGLATLESATSLISPVQPFRNLVQLHGGLNSLYLPKTYPIELIFKYKEGLKSGIYKMVVSGPDSLGINNSATLIPGTGSTLYSPPNTITPINAYPFPVKTY